MTEGTLEHLFDGAAEQVQIEFYGKLNGGEEPTEIPADATAVFYVNSNLHIVAYSNQTAVELSTTIASNDWNFFEVSGDYTNDTWSLSVNGTNALQDFPFYNASAGFSAIQLSEGISTSYLDNVNVSLPNEDSDGDGLPDEWEQRYYGGTTNANPLALCANGINTVEEAYIAGLNPTNASSTFLISALRPLASANTLQWQSVSGRLYNVYWTSNLLSPFGLIGSNLTAASFTDTNETSSEQGFYKIEVEME